MSTTAPRQCDDTDDLLLCRLCHHGGYQNSSVIVIRSSRHVYPLYTFSGHSTSAERSLSARNKWTESRKKKKLLQPSATTRKYLPRHFPGSICHHQVVTHSRIIIAPDRLCELCADIFRGNVELEVIYDHHPNVQPLRQSKKRFCPMCSVFE